MKESIRDRAARIASEKRKRSTVHASSGTHANGKPAAADDASPDKRPKPAPPPPDRVQAYFDCLTSTYYARNMIGDFQKFPNREFSLLLRRNGFHKDEDHGTGLSYLEEEMLRIMTTNVVHFAGPLGGYDPGIYDSCGCAVLVTRGPKFIKPIEGKWPTLRDFVGQLLGEQARYFYAWLKWALDSLRRGLPWSPGQMLAVAGPPNSGKSFLQTLLTPILGGRVSSPYAYMAGGTNFNAEIFGAEHALIGDQNHAVDMRSRRNFGSAIKNLVVNKEQYIHTKGKTPITLMPFVRVSLTLNDNPEALLVLPPLDSDVADKIMLLHAKPVNFPWPSKRYPDSQSYYEQLVRELPAFLYHLRRWRIPATIADQRYGVASFHDPALVDALDALSLEIKLHNVIETYIFIKGVVEFWEGTAEEMEGLIRKKLSYGEAANLFPFSSACGGLLAALCKKFPEKYTVRKIGGNRNCYLIHADR